MPTPSGYQRILFCGIPVWKNAAGGLFAYETNGAVGVQIGTLADGFAEDWAARLQPGLDAYRAGLKARARGAAPSK